MGLTDWFYLTILTCVFIYINNKINRIDLEIRLVFIYSCLISYILTIISAFVAIFAFRIFFEVSSHPGIRFFLLCAISTLSDQTRPCKLPVADMGGHEQSPPPTSQSAVEKAHSMEKRILYLGPHGKTYSVSGGSRKGALCDSQIVSRCRGVRRRRGDGQH